MSVDQPEGTTLPAPSTGNTAVDGVLASLDTLADLPVAEHVAVFERAHDQLRAALDAPAGPKPPTPPAQAETPVRPAAPGPSAG